MDNNKPDIVRMAGAAYLKTTLSKIYNVRAGSCNSLQAYDSEFSIGRVDRDHEGLARDSNVSESGIEAIQKNIMRAVYMTPDNISLILSDVCELIARDSFHLKWTTFVPDLIEGLKRDDPDTTLRVFRTFSPVLKKIRHMYRSDDLYTQILYVIENFGPALTEYTGVSSLLN